MEAIDYKKLLREERKRAKQKKKERELQKAVKVPLDAKKKEQENCSVDGSHNSCDNNNNEKKADARYNWEYPDGFLGFGELTLKSMCEDPRSISYSSAALEKQTPKVPNINTNENESVKIITNESNTSEPCGVDSNTVKPVSPESALVNWLQNLPSGDSGLGEWKVMSYGKRRVCMFGEEETNDGVLPPPLAEIARELVKRNVFPSSSSPSCPPPNHVLLNEYQPGQGILPHTDGPLYEHRTATLSLGSDIVIEFTKRLASNEIGTSAKESTTKTTTIVMDSKDGGDDHRERKEANSNHRTGKDNTDNNNNNNIRRLDTGDDQSPSSAPIQVLLESGSLLVFQEDAYMNYCHGIAMDVWRDVTTDHCLNAPSGKIVPRGLRYSLTFRHKKAETKQIQ